MRKIGSTIWVLFVLFDFCPLECFGQKSNLNGWSLVSKEDGIEVFTKTEQNSPIKKIRITCTVNSSIPRISDFLSSVSQYASWVYKCKSSFRLKEISKNEFNYYITLDFPFPLEDRDLTINSKHWIDSKTGAYQAHSVSFLNNSFRNDKYVHISEFESSWNIIPMKDGKLSIEYITLSNPGGDIPLWLVNMVIAKGPLETMKRFLKMVKIDEQTY